MSWTHPFYHIFTDILLNSCTEGLAGLRMCCAAHGLILILDFLDKNEEVQDLQNHILKIYTHSFVFSVDKNHLQQSGFVPMILHFICLKQVCSVNDENAHSLLCKSLASALWKFWFWLLGLLPNTDISLLLIYTPLSLPPAAGRYNFTGEGVRKKGKECWFRNSDKVNPITMLMYQPHCSEFPSRISYLHSGSFISGSLSQQFWLYPCLPSQESLLF